MKALRYLLMMLAVMGVLSVSAQTPKYGKPYKPYGRSNREVEQQQAQMPSAEMRSTGSVIMASGSTLPQAAVTGTYTADDTEPTGGDGPKRPLRRDPGDDPFGGETIGGTENPLEPGTPVGDAMIPLALLACAYLGMRVFLKRKRALSRSANESQRPNHSANW